MRNPRRKIKKLEGVILKEAMNTSKFPIDTIKFRILFATQISPKQNEKTLKDLKEFRSNNWDKSLEKEEAYKKYLNLY